MKITREWCMPNHCTFGMPPVAAFIQRHLRGISVDPFARNSRIATFTNDLNPDTAAQYHLEAEVFCKHLKSIGVLADTVLFDPPYSPRQISECYQSCGLEVGMKETQNAAIYKRVRDALVPIMAPDAVALSFGWHSNGFGKKRGFEIIEILLVAHGGAHNDTICLAERRVDSPQMELPHDQRTPLPE